MAEWNLTPQQRKRRSDETEEQYTRRMASGKHRLFKEGELRRHQMIEHLRVGWSSTDACEKIGIRYGTYAQWRKRYPEFRAQADAAKNGAKAVKKGLAVDKDQEIPDASLAFVDWRFRWFGRLTPWFQLQMDAELARMRAGNIVLVLLPPEHGKTTWFEDRITHRLIYAPDTRCHVGSESRQLSEKILARIKDRLDPSPGSKFVEFVNRYGPFAPPRTGSDDYRHRQPWTASYFDVYRKAEHDERDFSMAALGFGSQIIGSRSDWLHCDDLQSRKTLNATERNLEIWKQDWLSRPGETGITSVVGNRVDEGDIYEGMIEHLDDDLLTVIRYPAILSSGEPLWPEKWSLEQLDRMKRKVGEATWERNWMQRPRPVHLQTFSPDIIDKNLRPDVRHMPFHGFEGRIVYIGVDPGLNPGKTSLCAIAMRPGRPGFDVVASVEYDSFTRNEQIMGALENLALDLENRGMVVTDVIIESKNFQAGLCRDERLLAMRDRYGWTISEHMTGWNKYDENIGLPSMVTTFVKGDIGLPWADDDQTRFNIGELRAQLLAWRPFIKGTKLRQDRVMALYFPWIRWRTRRGQETNLDEARSTETFKVKALPYAPTRTGLILPRGAYPSVLAGR